MSYPKLDYVSVDKQFNLTEPQHLNPTEQQLSICPDEHSSCTLLTVNCHVDLFVDLVCFDCRRLLAFEEATLPETQNEEEEEEKTTDNCSYYYPNPISALSLRRLRLNIV